MDKSKADKEMFDPSPKGVKFTPVPKPVKKPKTPKSGKAVGKIGKK